jgi:hypothetical protein
MPALAIRSDIGSEELRRRARRERDGRISARLIAIAWKPTCAPLSTRCCILSEPAANGACCRRR